MQLPVNQQNGKDEPRCLSETTLADISRAGNDDTWRGSRQRDDASASSTQEGKAGTDAPDDDLDERDFTFKFWFGEDGRVNMNITHAEQDVGRSDDMYTNMSIAEDTPPASDIGDDDEIPPSYTPMPEDEQQQTMARPRPAMNILMLVAGSAADVHLFISVGSWLRNSFGHRVKVATHPQYRFRVEAPSLEFFTLGVDDFDILESQATQTAPDAAAAVTGLKAVVPALLKGSWEACFALSASGAAPFVPDAIVANPQSLAHVHCAEKLGVPLHILSTMPWSPTRQFPHPLARLGKVDTSSKFANLVSFAAVETMVWREIGDVVNKFRKEQLALEPLDGFTAPGLLRRLRTPATYVKLPGEASRNDALLLEKKPADWGPHINLCHSFEDAAAGLSEALLARHPRCAMLPSEMAGLRCKRPAMLLSPLAAATLVKAGVLNATELQSLRTVNYDLARKPRDPLTGLASATHDHLVKVALGVTAGPREAYNQAKKGTAEPAAQSAGQYRSVAASAAKGVGDIVTATLKTPVTMTSGLADGFHNIPRLYGDDTVRQQDSIDGWKSGLAAAGKGFGQGLYDGLTGFVTQPVRGARQEGGVGFIKGMGKGIGGLVFKPAAGACGVPGYAFMGVYKELKKLGTTDFDALLVAGRMAQGGERWERMKDAERLVIVRRWFDSRVKLGASKA